MRNPFLVPVGKRQDWQNGEEGEILDCLKWILCALSTGFSKYHH